MQGDRTTPTGRLQRRGCAPVDRRDKQGVADEVSQQHAGKTQRHRDIGGHQGIKAIALTAQTGSLAALPPRLAQAIQPQQRNSLAAQAIDQAGQDVVEQAQLRVRRVVGAYHSISAGVLHSEAVGFTLQRTRFMIFKPCLL
jgi:hypothetical protein